jgi:hypothetical protein
MRKTFSHRLIPDSCQTHQHKTDLLTPDSSQKQHKLRNSPARKRKYATWYRNRRKGKYTKRNRKNKQARKLMHSVTILALSRKRTSVNGRVIVVRTWSEVEKSANFSNTPHHHHTHRHQKKAWKSVQRFSCRQTDRHGDTNKLTDASFATFIYKCA